MKNIWIGTNGCVEAQLSSNRLKRFFGGHDINIVTHPNDADIIIFYTCGLRNSSEADSLHHIGELQKIKKPDAPLIVWGCLPKINPQALKTVWEGPIIGALDIDYFSTLVPDTKIPLHQIPHAASKASLSTLAPPSLSGIRNPDSLTTLILKFKQIDEGIQFRFSDPPKLYCIPIAKGCSGGCTFCSERPVFGRVTSRSIDDIVLEFKEGLKQGYNTFSLIATDPGCYGHDLGIGLPDLLTRMIAEGESFSYHLIINQIEFHFLKDMLPQLEPILASGKVEEIMSPVESGSTRILKSMGRKYTAEDWKKTMVYIKDKFPKVIINTQIMVGFPGETEEDFHATCALLDPPLCLDKLYVFAFSPRPTTRAASFPDQIDEETKERRAVQVLQKFARSWFKRRLRV